MGCHTAGGLWRHLRWPPFWTPSWILPKIKAQKRQKLEIFDAGHVECDIIKDFAAFCWHFFPFSPKMGKNTRSFLQKWLDHLLLMTSYLVIIVTDSHQICVKMCLRDMRTATETADLDNYLTWKNSRKALRGVGIHPSPPLYVRGFINITVFCCRCKCRMHTVTVTVTVILLLG